MAEVLGVGVGTRVHFPEVTSAAGKPLHALVPSYCCLEVFVFCVNAGAEGSKDLPQNKFQQNTLLSNAPFHCMLLWQALKTMYWVQSCLFNAILWVFCDQRLLDVSGLFSSQCCFQSC